MANNQVTYVVKPHGAPVREDYACGLGDLMKKYDGIALEGVFVAVDPKLVQQHNEKLAVEAQEAAVR